MEGVFITSNLADVCCARGIDADNMLAELTNLMSHLKQFEGPNRAQVAHHLHETHGMKLLLTAIQSLGHMTPCRAGCSYCCYQHVVAAAEEVELLYQYAQHKKIKISEKILRYQSKFDNPDDYWKRFSKKTKCVFLQNDGLCSVYQHRPLACRTLLSASKTCDLCKPSKEAKSLPYIGDLFGELLLTAMFNLNRMERSSMAPTKWNDKYLFRTLSKQLLETIVKK